MLSALIKPTALEGVSDDDLKFIDVDDETLYKEDKDVYIGVKAKKFIKEYNENQAVEKEGDCKTAPKELKAS